MFAIFGTSSNYMLIRDEHRIIPGICGVDTRQLTRIIRKHGAERILFGTDFPWCSQKAHVEWIDSLPLTANEKAAIFYKNAAELLKLEV